MATIELTTVISAPITICFDLALSIDLEADATKAYKIRAVSGITSGKIGAGQRVGWESRQFGLTVSHLSEITGFQPPSFFQDSMVAGVFKSFQHDHFFNSLSSGETEMRDVLRFGMPLWLLGSVSERFIVRRRLVHLIALRNALLKATAQSMSS